MRLARAVCQLSEKFKHKKGTKIQASTSDHNILAWRDFLYQANATLLFFPFSASVYTSFSFTTTSTTTSITTSSSTTIAYFLYTFTFFYLFTSLHIKQDKCKLFNTE